jgi:predicted nucleotidyltransferase
MENGNRVYYKADTENPIYPELRRLIEKTAGLVDVLRQTIFGGTANRITVAFVFGSTARGEDDTVSDVDLFVIGRVTAFGINPKLKRAEKRLGREINATVFSPTEFAEKARAGSHFIKSVLDSQKLFVIGTQYDLDAAAKGRRRTDAHPDQE